MCDHWPDPWVWESDEDKALCPDIKASSVAHYCFYPSCILALEIVSLQLEPKAFYVKFSVC